MFSGRAFAHTYDIVRKYVGTNVRMHWQGSPKKMMQGTKDAHEDSPSKSAGAGGQRCGICGGYSTYVLGSPPAALALRLFSFVFPFLRRKTASAPLGQGGR